MDATTPIGQGTPAPLSISSAQRAARAYGVAPLRQAAPPAVAKTPTNAQRLVAAVVPGKVDFSGDAPAAAPGALPFYRNPADKNAAAIGIEAGRTLDVSA